MLAGALNRTIDTTVVPGTIILLYDTTVLSAVRWTDGYTEAIPVSSFV